MFVYMSALRQTGDLSRPVTAGIGSSTTTTLLRIDGIDNDWLTDSHNASLLLQVWEVSVSQEDDGILHADVWFVSKLQWVQEIG